MLFSSPIFIFIFLPVALAGYYLSPSLRVRNLWLLLASLLFYAWGEIGFLWLLVLSVILNFFLGRALDRSATLLQRKWLAGIAIAGNLGLLAFFKYFNFGIGLLNGLLVATGAKPQPAGDVLLPLGISFFTFHALSYQIDVYRRKQPAATNPCDLALYIFFFPQLIAGPILRWNSIAPQLTRRDHSIAMFADGVRRFVQGLGKKVLVANTLAVPADGIFALPAAQLSMPDAWVGALCYTLQIYFDFSGYSDMALGLGKMFGFHFMENFDYPLISQSIREFWRRWHISLSTWFRDYLFVPLGGNRVSPARNALNLLLVFLLCGLWHGASLTFVVWGLYHGLFLILERSGAGLRLASLPRILRHFYALFVILIGWVIFRSNDFASATRYFYAMAGGASALEAQPMLRFLDGQVLYALFFGCLFSTPIADQIRARLALATQDRPVPFAIAHALEVAGLIILFFLSLTCLARGTYNPFIYFRF